MTGDDALLDGLVAGLGPTAVLTGADAEVHLVDPRRSVAGSALAVVRPGSHEEVVACVELCRRHDAVIVAQGGNTGMSGGQIPVPGDRPVVVLSTTRMNRILDANPAASTITAEAGVTIAALAERAVALGRAFGPDWGARGSATIGGAVATNAGGNNVVRFGPMRRHVLGLRAVLADGRTWDGLRSLRKDASGYDLKQLLIGSEGTLGIVTEVVVDLQPALTDTRSAWAALDGLDALGAAAEVVGAAAGGALTAFELMPGFGVAAACRRLGVAPPLPAGHDSWFLLVKLAAAAPVDDLLTACLAAGVEAGCLLDAVVAATPDQEANLWKIRDELSPSRLFPLQDRAVKGDLAVPLDRLVALYRGVDEIRAELTPAAVTYGFGHVGDGNLHLYVLGVDEAGATQIDRARVELTAAIDGLVLSLGGTLSGEHGVGRELLGRIGAQKPAVEWELMRAVKAVFDPDNRLNPGVLLG